MVYLKFEMKRKVVLINPSQRPPKDLAVRKAVLLSLFEDITCRKASEQYGYYLAVHTLESIGEGKVHSPNGDIILPVTFTCIAMKPVKGDIFIGTVDKVLKQGVVLKYGPMEDILLSEKEMKGYGYDGRVEEEPKFVNESLRLRIGSGGRVRFTVAGSKWIESERVFQVQATLGDDGVDGVFGPV